jgi:hypothetical protein
MADEALPSISAGVVGSRFVTQSDIEAAKARRDEQWKAAYARFLRLSLSQLSFSLNHFLPPLGWAKNRPLHRKRTRTMVVVWQRCVPISPIMLRTAHHRVHLVLLETRRQSRKSRTMAQRRVSIHTLLYPPRQTLGSQTRGMGREE